MGPVLLMIGHSICLYSVNLAIDITVSVSNVQNKPCKKTSSAELVIMIVYNTVITVWLSLIKHMSYV